MATTSLTREDVVIRRESPDQPQVRALLDALDAYLASLYLPQDNHILDLDALCAPQVCFLVARHEGRAVGCGAYRRMPGEDATGGRLYAEIKRMVVDPSLRGRGIGAALLGRLESLMLDEGLELALLETGAAQAMAVGLYQRSGYQHRAPFAGYPDNGLSLFLEKRLSR
jgi:putative acetyltransferase